MAGEVCKVLMPDQIGFGKSSKPRHYQFSFTALAENPLELMDALVIGKSVIVGHSMGGMLASRFTQRRPWDLLQIKPLKWSVDHA